VASTVAQISSEIRTERGATIPDPELIEARDKDHFAFQRIRSKASTFVSRGGFGRRFVRAAHCW
jgi:hypothetical protein